MIPQIDFSPFIEGRETGKNQVASQIRKAFREIGFFTHAENLGYDSVWVTDSQMLFSDCYAVLALAAQATRTLRLGRRLRGALAPPGRVRQDDPAFQLRQRRRLLPSAGGDSGAGVRRVVTRLFAFAFARVGGGAAERLDPRARVPRAVRRGVVLLGGFAK